MRRSRSACVIVLVCVLGFAATGCGSSGSDKASDPPASTPASTSPSTSASPTAQSEAAVDYTLVQLVSSTEADGKVTQEAVALPDQAAVAAYANRFSNRDMGAKLTAAVRGADVAAGQALYATVVYVGCGQPKSLSVTAASDGGLNIEGVDLPDPSQECFAAMTTVAVISAPATYAA